MAVIEPRATEEDCRAYYAGQEAEELDVAIVQGTASRTVESLAPQPEGYEAAPEDYADYDQARRQCELLVGRYIWKTDGLTLASKSLSGVTSKSYAKLSEVKSVVAGAMGSYYRGPSGASGAGGGTGYVTTLPF